MLEQLAGCLFCTSWYEDIPKNPDLTYKLYEAIRRNNPDIPYFMVTRPNFYFDEDAICRRDIIMNSYLKARSAGDKNVYFIDGSAFFNGRDPRDMTPDMTHPNDEGYALMAKYIGDIISKMMKC